MNSTLLKKTVNAALFCAYIALLGGILAQFSMGNNPRFLNLKDSVDSQLAILERRPFVYSGFTIDYPSWRSRILVPYAIKALSAATRMRFSQSYVMMRWITASLALAAFAFLTARRLRTGYWFAVAAAALLALVLFPAFLHIYEIPTDFPDAFFYCLLTLFALEKRRWLFAAALLAGAMNRESTIFATIVWFGLYAIGPSRRTFLVETLYCALMGALGAGLVLWLRARYAVPPNLEPPPTGPEFLNQPLMPGPGAAIWHLRQFFAHPYFGSGIFYLLGYIGFFAGLFLVHWRSLPAPIRRLVLAAAVLFAISLPFANLPEIRVYIPSLVLLTFSALELLRQRVAGAAAS